jgi:hypothetical protein
MLSYVRLGLLCMVLCLGLVCRSFCLLIVLFLANLLIVCVSLLLNKSYICLFHKKIKKLKTLFYGDSFFVLLLTDIVVVMNWDLF